MNKSLKKIGSLLLALVMVFLPAACKKNNGPATPNPDGPSSSGGNKPAEVITDEYLLDEAESKYVIVTPKTLQQYEDYALSEFNTFFKQATGIELPVRTDDGIEFDENSKYISFGDNKVREQAGVDYGGKDKDGYTIKTVGKSIVIVGGSDLGVLYGTYSLLDYLVDFETYGIGNYYTKKNVSRIPLYKFDETVEPDVSERNCGSTSILKNMETLIRMRFSPSRTSLAINGSLGHTSMAFLPKDTYLETHRKWYMDGNNPTQLCYTAHGDPAEYEAMLDACLETLKASLKRDTKSEWLNFSLSDDYSWCTCEACNESSKKYGVSSASVIRFLNRLMEKTYEWFETDEGKDYKRDLKTLFYAYQQLETAPVKKNDKGDFEPIDESVVCNEYVFPQLALTIASYALPTDHKINEKALNNIKSWAVCSKGLLSYMYSANYRNFLIPINTAQHLQNWYQTYRDYGMFYMYDLGATPETQFSSGWDTLKSYLDYKLGWNIDLDLNATVEDFFLNAYRDAGKTMLEFYKEYLVLATHNECPDFNYDYIIQGARLLKAEYWPKTILEKWRGYTTQALEAVEHYKIEDEQTYQMLEKWIMAERVWVDYLIYQLYGGTYKTDELATLKAELSEAIEVSTITRFSEIAAISTVTSSLNN